MTYRVHIERNGRRWSADLNASHDLSLPLAFNGQQPRFFSAPNASTTPYTIGDFSGSVAQGASCNCNTVSLTPHCNGTHTESIAHIVATDAPIRDIAPRELLTACLISITPRAASQVADALNPLAQSDDPVIDSRQLRDALLSLDADTIDANTIDALIVRTLPNDSSKTTRNYDNLVCPPYFTAAAMQVAVDFGIRHLLTDLPSLDRMRDDGLLAAHRTFWGLPLGSTDAKLARRPNATVTELCFVDNAVADGWYLLNLQVAPFMADAAPSRPIIYPLLPL
jgi:kynurenine formamidase